MNWPSIVTFSLHPPLGLCGVRYSGLSNTFSDDWTRVLITSHGWGLYRGKENKTRSGFVDHKYLFQVNKFVSEI